MKIRSKATESLDKIKGYINEFYMVLFFIMAGMEIPTLHDFSDGRITAIELRNELLILAALYVGSYVCARVITGICKYTCERIGVYLYEREQLDK